MAQRLRHTLEAKGILSAMKVCLGVVTALPWDRPDDSRLGVIPAPGIWA
jgi:hypothetical protein